MPAGRHPAASWRPASLARRPRGARGPRRDDQPLGDLRVHEPVDQEGQHFEPAGGQSRRIGTGQPASAVGDTDSELSHAPGHAPGQRLGAESPDDLERLGERVFVVEQGQHQRPVVTPPHVAEGVGRSSPVRLDRSAAMLPRWTSMRA